MAVRCHLINKTRPIVWCQVVSSIPPSIHRWRLIAGRLPLYVTGGCGVTQSAGMKKLSRFQLFCGWDCRTQKGQKGQASFKWMRKPALAAGHLFCSKYSLTPKSPFSIRKFWISCGTIRFSKRLLTFGFTWYTNLCMPHHSTKALYTLRL